MNAIEFVAWFCDFWCFSWFRESHKRANQSYIIATTMVRKEDEYYATPRINSQSQYGCFQKNLGGYTTTAYKYKISVLKEKTINT